jgi:hypothetical protein
MVNLVTVYCVGDGLNIGGSEVDPIVASFSGGAVGVISSLMVVEINNVKQQERKRCRYCHGTGILSVHYSPNCRFSCFRGFLSLNYAI